MSDFDDILTAVDSSFAVFEETIVYRKNSGATRTIKAIVTREPPDTPASGNIGMRPKLIISVKNHVTAGVLATELDEGGDRFQVAQKYGGTAAMFSAKVIGQDGARIDLELR